MSRWTVIKPPLLRFFIQYEENSKHCDYRAKM
nr:MAG TPA: hypothetical protein [Caudoviricetes sp.]